MAIPTTSSNELRKDISKSITDPGQPAEYGIQQQLPVCTQVRRTELVPNYVTVPTGQYVNGKPTYYAYVDGYTTRVYYETVCTGTAVPGSAPKPYIPPSYQTQLNIGWNSGARSIADVPADGAFHFGCSPSATGVVAGLANDTSYRFSSILFGIYFTKGSARVVEAGVTKSAAAPFVDGDIFTVQRTGSMIRYYKNGELFHTSDGQSYGRTFGAVSMYTGGDALYNATLGPALVGNGTATASMRALSAVAGEGTLAQASGAMLPMTSSATSRVHVGAVQAMVPMQGMAANRAYASAVGVMAPIASHSENAEPVVGVSSGIGVMSQLSAVAFSTTHGGVAAPSTSLFDTTALWSPQQWEGYTVTIIAGAGAGQTRTISDNTQQALRFNTPWGTLPDATSRYEIRLDGVTVYSGWAATDGNDMLPLSELAADRPYGGARGTMAPFTAFATDHAVPRNAMIGQMSPCRLVASGEDLAPNSFRGRLSFGLRAYGGATARVSMPAPLLLATGEGTVVGRARLTLGKVLLNASGMAGGVGSALLRAHTPFKLLGLGGGHFQGLGPRPSLMASGLRGSVGAVRVTCPLFTLSARGHQENYGAAYLVMPALTPVGSAVGYLTAPRAYLMATGKMTVTVDYEAYSVNLGMPAEVSRGDDETILNATTHYSNYPFDRIVRYNDRYYGVARDGLYELGGDTDNGAPIPWAWKTCQTDFGAKELKRVVSAYVGGRVLNTLTFSLDVGGDEDGMQIYQYTTPRTSAAQNYRQKFGKGVRARYYAIGVSDPTGQDFEIDTLDLEVTKLARSI